MGGGSVVEEGGGGEEFEGYEEGEYVEGEYVEEVRGLGPEGVMLGVGGEYWVDRSSSGIDASASALIRMMSAWTPAAAAYE